MLLKNRLVFASVMYMSLLKSDITKLSLFYYFGNIWIIRIQGKKKSSQLDFELSENTVMPTTKHQSLKQIFFCFWSLFSPGKRMIFFFFLDQF